MLVHGWPFVQMDDAFQMIKELIESSETIPNKCFLPGLTTAMIDICNQEGFEKEKSFNPF